MRAASAYGAACRALDTPRSIEYRVFSQITGRLAAASAADAPRLDLADALAENAKLWGALLGDVADPRNALPEALRGSLASLALFVERHSQKVLAEDADPSALVEINTAVMRGLRGAVGSGSA
ncbi:MAG: flagellar biosynthesis regulator FlaF [Paracoccaceae bacterium]